MLGALVEGYHADETHGIEGEGDDEFCAELISKRSTDGTAVNEVEVVVDVSVNWQSVG